MATNSKKNIMRRSPSSIENRVNGHIKQADASFSELWSRPLGNLLTLAVIAMALTIPSCLYLMSKNISHIAQNVATSSRISVYLQEMLPEARLMIIKDEIESWDSVEHIEYISSQQGLEDLSQRSGFEQSLSLLDEQSLPAVFIITPKHKDQAQIKEIITRLKNHTGIINVRVDEDWFARLSALKTLAHIIVITLTLLMLSAVFLIVGNTLRFNVLANKEEIQTMKIIGATDHFISRPYLYSGMWFGFIGASIAWLLTWAITYLLKDAVNQLASLYDSHYQLQGLHWDESLLLLILGTLLGSIAAKLSASKHLKEIEPDH